MITFNGETRPYVGDFKLIDNDLGITCNETFPIYVQIDWQVTQTNVLENTLQLQS